MGEDGVVRLEVRYRDPVDMMIREIDQVPLSIPPGTVLQIEPDDEVLLHFIDGKISYGSIMTRAIRLKDKRQAGGDYQPRSSALMGAGWS